MSEEFDLPAQSICLGALFTCRAKRACPTDIELKAETASFERGSEMNQLNRVLLPVQAAQATEAYLRSSLGRRSRGSAYQIFVG